MRAGLLALAVVACGPRVSTAPRAFDRDLETRAAPAVTEPAPAAAAAEATRPVAPRAKGVRTGTITRAHLVAVLDAGPGTFLRQLEVAPHMTGDRFVGWRLVQLLDRTGPLHDVDLAPGDVLLAVNGQAISRPEQLQAVWDSLRTANDVTAKLSRGNQALELHFAIEPPLPAVPPTPPIALPTR
jgi:type II secretory pathway component PulC